MNGLREDVIKRIKAIVAECRDEPTPLMIILAKIQGEFGSIPLDVQEVVSAETGIPVAEIYGVVTFYSFFSLKPKGKYIIGVCLGTACYVKGSKKVLDAFRAELHIEPGETTPDGLFTLDALRCLGACAIAPACTINGEVYSRLSAADVPLLIKKYRDLEVQAQ